MHKGQILITFRPYLIKDCSNVQNKMTCGLGFLKISKNRQRTASSGKVLWSLLWEPLVRVKSQTRIKKELLVKGSFTWLLPASSLFEKERITQYWDNWFVVHSLLQYVCIIIPALLNIFGYYYIDLQLLFFPFHYT